MERKGRRVTTFHTWLWVILFPIGRNVDSISHLFVNFSTNSSFCQSALGMGLYTEGHRSEWLHSEFSVFRSLPREFYIAIFRRSDTQSKIYLAWLLKHDLNHMSLFHNICLKKSHWYRFDHIFQAQNGALFINKGNLVAFFSDYLHLLAKQKGTAKAGTHLWHQKLYKEGRSSCLLLRRWDLRAYHNEITHNIEGFL